MFLYNHYSSTIIRQYVIEYKQIGIKQELGYIIYIELYIYEYRPRIPVYKF